MKQEIGSDFWDYPLKSSNEPFTVLNVPDEWKYTYLLSGRSAIYTAVSKYYTDGDCALVPYYTCDTVNDAIKKAGFAIRTYSINRDLSVNKTDLVTKIIEIKPKVIIMHSYFGFNTISDCNDIIEFAHENKAIIIEDLTHSVFSSFSRCNADIYVASLRKFMGIPDGGLIISKDSINQKFETAPKEIDNVAREAFFLKENYIFEKDDTDKSVFRKKYSDLKQLIVENDGTTLISDFAFECINKADVKKISDTRRINFKVLSERLSGSDYYTPVFRYVSSEDTPLFYPVYIANERKNLQSYLADNLIYAPVIWPKDSNLGAVDSEGDYIYDHILCLPCDQRYSSDDMIRVSGVFSRYFEDKK